MVKNPIKFPLQPWHETGQPWLRVHTDFAGSIEGKWILITVDSQFLNAEVFSTITSQATCHHFRSIFERYGPPQTLVSDNGTQFTST